MPSSKPDLFFEYKYTRLLGPAFIAIDEAGRGPLAGPLSVSGVLIKDCETLLDIEGINDSKKLSEMRREELFKKSSLVFEFKNILISPEDIDKLGLTLCLERASAKIIKHFSNSNPCFILLDGSHDYIKHHSLETFTITKGDSKCLSIALASIHAKVTRDRVMLGLDKKFPGYNFSKNKGYGTLEHRLAIKSKGPSLVHRKTFLGNLK